MTSAAGNRVMLQFQKSKASKPAWKSSFRITSFSWWPSERWWTPNTNPLWRNGGCRTLLTPFSRRYNPQSPVGLIGIITDCRTPLWHTCLIWFDTVYGPPDPLHCSRNSNHTVREVCKWNTEASWRRGGERSRFQGLSFFSHLQGLMQQITSCCTVLRTYYVLLPHYK